MFCGMSEIFDFSVLCPIFSGIAAPLSQCYFGGQSISDPEAPAAGVYMTQTSWSEPFLRFVMGQKKITNFSPRLQILRSKHASDGQGLYLLPANWSQHWKNQNMKGIKEETLMILLCLLDARHTKYKILSLGFPRYMAEPINSPFVCV